MAIEIAEYRSTNAGRRRGAAAGRPQQPGNFGSRLATGLGWFSVGIGIAEVIAPRSVARLVGARKSSALLRVFGIREIAAGVGILKSRNPATALWARVGGDIVDLVFMASVMKDNRSNQDRAIGAAIAVAGVTALDILAAQQAAAQAPQARNARLEASLLVNKSPEECYRFWHDVENLPRFMSYVNSVRVTSERRSHWIARTPADAPLEWDSEIVEDIPDQRIAWRSLPGSDVTHSGSVEFERAPGNRGTVIRIQADYGNTAHALGAALARWFGKNPEQIAYKDLRRFKQLLETGEIITTEGQPAGRTSGTTWLDSIAR